MSLASVNPRIYSEYNLPTDGSFDILLVQFSEGFPNSKLTFSFALFNQDSGMLEGVTRKVTGVQKAAQKFLYTLLTTKGTDAFNPERGTDITEILSGGNLYSQGYAEGIISGAVKDAANQVSSFSALDPDPSSRLSSVEVNNVQIGVNSVAVTMTIYTDAGDQAPIFVPFPRYDLDINA